MGRSLGSVSQQLLWLGCSAPLLGCRRELWEKALEFVSLQQLRSDRRATGWLRLLQGKGSGVFSPLLPAHPHLPLQQWCMAA